jgi:phosphoribosylformimino-5-aminoimidazole carboxamide ribotide isomerase
MIIYPAIDLKDGKCVRLIKGDFATTHSVAENALSVAADFAASGAKWLHCVDLDGARLGERKNTGVIGSLCSQSGLNVELGGGLRTLDDLEAANVLGAARFIIGSAAVTDREFVKTALNRYGERVAVGIDALNGSVRTHGWERDSGVDALTFAVEMFELGVRTLIFTDVATDGTLSGPPLDALRRLRKRLPNASLTASGGIATISDITALKELSCDGAIVGKAYYAGTLNLKEAIDITC